MIRLITTCKRHSTILFIAALAFSLARGVEGRAEAPQFHSEQERDAYIERLIRQINKSPIEPHMQFTPATRALVELGEVAMPRCLDLMLAEDEETRMRAAVTIAEIVWNIVSRETPPVLDPQGLHPRAARDLAEYEACQELWESLGSLDHKGTLESRAVSVARWRNWLQARSLAGR